ncbi:MAG: hypothetical protein ACXWQQ_11660 [Pseudobdellovibrio sp.]
MATCVVWIDSVHAKVFTITAAGVKRKTVKLNFIQHSNGNHERNLLNAEEKFFHKVADSIHGPLDRLLVMGSGVAKENFKKHLDKHYHNELYKILASVETLSELTDNQILEASRNYFKKYDLYGLTQ